MTEQELRIEFQRISEENNYLQMLNEDDAVDLCKSYANARESKEIAELKAKNAALVAALGKIRNACRIAVTTRDFQEKGTMYKIETCIDSALAASEKGGAND